MADLPYTTYEDILSLVAVPCDEASAIVNPGVLEPMMRAELITRIPTHATIKTLANGLTVLKAWANCCGAYNLLLFAPHIITVLSQSKGDMETKVTPNVKLMLDNLRKQADSFAAAANSIYSDSLSNETTSYPPLFGKASPTYDPITGLTT